ncbi:MAG: ACT domain-containing protein [Nanoarchaeota archaeon]|nr:ACT domain-containing protein [Nanoarchaeota archaeon]
MFEFIFGKKFKENYLEFVAKAEPKKKKDMDIKFKEIMNKSELDIKTDMNFMVLKNNFVCLDKVNAIYKDLFNKNSIFTVFYGTNTITVAFDKRYKDYVFDNLREFLIQQINGVVKIHIKGDESIQATPGIVHSIVSGFAHHGVNILSILGSYDEIILFVESKDFEKLTNMLKEIKK